MPETQDVHVEEAEKQAVVDAYQDLGLVQVSGYLNVRETPGSDGKIIGKLEQNSACEILGTEGDWDHISSGGIEGYIHNQYVISGEEARTKALEYVTKMAIVQTEKLNIRQEPVLDPAECGGTGAGQRALRGRGGTGGLGKDPGRLHFRRLCYGWIWP